MEKMFETATRAKMRFPFKGQISVEDLWDLSVENLDSVFKTLNSRSKQVKEESLLQAKTAQDKELDMQIEIVKHIFNVKVEEANAKLKAKEKREQKQKLLEIKNSKENEELLGKSKEEIQAMIDALDQ